ncbi:MAG: type II toxin-antitoxin system VapC family toxin [Actinomycetota bacterium]|nr:type II toxin-antitoxin system VapC family toxin [Actinomycetota bacterium]HZY64312.1 type II toxin-antitoxin system VapC family toxin [Rubrobacteraceae bacterium]
MRVLLDTHVFLWWIKDDPRLSERALETISDGANEVLFSAASGWEIAIKAGMGKLDVPGDLAAYLEDQLSRNAVGVLPVYLGHALRVHDLLALHRDPFDRLLVSQSIHEDIPMISGDPQIARYPVDVLW